jgi:hypothetical protein
VGSIRGGILIEALLKAEEEGVTPRVAVWEEEHVSMPVAWQATF